MNFAQDAGFESGFKKALEEGALLLPKIGYFLLILIVGIFIAKFVQKILTKVLQKVGFDRLVERGGVKQALSKSKYDAASILARWPTASRCSSSRSARSPRSTSSRSRRSSSAASSTPSWR